MRRERLGRGAAAAAQEGMPRSRSAQTGGPGGVSASGCVFAYVCLR